MSFPNNNLNYLRNSKPGGDENRRNLGSNVSNARINILPTQSMYGEGRNENPRKSNQTRRSIIPQHRSQPSGNRRKKKKPPSNSSVGGVGITAHVKPSHLMKVSTSSLLMNRFLPIKKRKTQDTSFQNRYGNVFKQRNLPSQRPINPRPNPPHNNLSRNLPESIDRMKLNKQIPNPLKVGKKIRKERVPPQMKISGQIGTNPVKSRQNMFFGQPQVGIINREAFPQPSRPIPIPRQTQPFIVSQMKQNRNVTLVCPPPPVALNTRTPIASSGTRKSPLRYPSNVLDGFVGLMTKYAPVSVIPGKKSDVFQPCLDNQKDDLSKLDFGMGKQGRIVPPRISPSHPQPADDQEGLYPFNKEDYDVKILEPPLKKRKVDKIDDMDNYDTERILGNKTTEKMWTINSLKAQRNTIKRQPILRNRRRREVGVSVISPTRPKDELRSNLQARSVPPPPPPPPQQQQRNQKKSEEYDEDEDDDAVIIDSKKIGQKRKRNPEVTKKPTHQPTQQPHQNVRNYGYNQAGIITPQFLSFIQQQNQLQMKKVLKMQQMQQTHFPFHHQQNLQQQQQQKVEKKKSQPKKRRRGRGRGRRRGKRGRRRRRKGEDDMMRDEEEDKEHILQERIRQLQKAKKKLQRQKDSRIVQNGTEIIQFDMFSKVPQMGRIEAIQKIIPIIRPKHPNETKCLIICLTFFCVIEVMEREVPEKSKKEKYIEVRRFTKLKNANPIIHCEVCNPWICVLRTDSQFYIYRLGDPNFMFPYSYDEHQDWGLTLPKPEEKKKKKRKKRKMEEEEEEEEYVFITTFCVFPPDKNVFLFGLSDGRVVFRDHEEEDRKVPCCEDIILRSENSENNNNNRTTTEVNEVVRLSCRTKKINRSATVIICWSNGEIQGYEVTMEKKKQKKKMKLEKKLLFRLNLIQEEEEEVESSEMTMMMSNNSLSSLPVIHCFFISRKNFVIAMNENISVFQYNSNEHSCRKTDECNIIGSNRIKSIVDYSYKNNYLYSVSENGVFQVCKIYEDITGKKEWNIRHEDWMIDVSENSTKRWETDHHQQTQQIQNIQIIGNEVKCLARVRDNGIMMGKEMSKLYLILGKMNEE